MKQICKTGEEEEADEIWFMSHFQDVSLQKYSILLLYVCWGFIFQVIWPENQNIL